MGGIRPTLPRRYLAAFLAAESLGCLAASLLNDGGDVLRRDLVYNLNIAQSCRQNEAQLARDALFVPSHCFQDGFVRHVTRYAGWQSYCRYQVLDALREVSIT